MACLPLAGSCLYWFVLGLAGHLKALLRQGAGMNSRPAAKIENGFCARRMALYESRDEFNFPLVVLIPVKEIVIAGISAERSQCITSLTAPAAARICASVSS